MVNGLRTDDSPGMDRLQEFALVLRTLRSDRGLTQEQLAELIDRSVQTVSNMERGETLPTIDTLARIAERLRIPLRELTDVFDPGETIAPDRLPLEVELLQSSRRLSLRDLRVAVKMLKAFPEGR
ncbi:MAG TPA: helix-turn-helix transcriptional regulator [Azospirillum sp.]